MKLHESGHHQAHSELTIAASSKSFIKANSRSDLGKFGPMGGRKIDRLDSLRGSTTDTLSEETFGPLSNVRFAVFALGSSAYPNFCAFGKYIDNILGELGGERLMKMATGDEICGQEQAFRKWAPEVFKVGRKRYRCHGTGQGYRAFQISIFTDRVRNVLSRSGGNALGCGLCAAERAVRDSQ